MADMKLPTYRNLPDSIARVRDSHLAVAEGIATAAEKHRDAMNEKRNKLHQQLALKTELPHATT
jgi:hypothetical protein